MCQTWRRSLCVTFGFVIAIIGLILGFHTFPKIVDNKIDNTVKLVNGSDSYKRWEDIPVPLYFKVYFFNVTNPEEVQLGAKPIVQEVGPYVYDQMRHKYDIRKDNDTLSYYQNQIFIFNEEASKPNQPSDIITVANLPLMVVITVAELLKVNVNKLNDYIDILFNKPKNLFLTTTVNKFLFDGIYIPCNNSKISFICKLIKFNAPKQLTELEDGRFKFSLLSYKNNTHDGYYTINSGTKNINFLGNIIAWQNSSKLNVWSSNGTCNNIYGTDTTIFSPYKTKLSTLKIFQSDICRSLNLNYYGEIIYKDLPGLRYVAGYEMLASGANNSANTCFCSKKLKGITENKCLLDGAMELWKCIKSPVILTLPHFYLGHEKYKSTVDGLNPNESLHENFIDLEPNSGTVLRGSKRVQFNIFYRYIKNVHLTKNLSDTLMPIVWIDEGIELNDKYTNLMKGSLIYPMKILKGIYWTLITVGLAISFIGLVWWMMLSNKSNDHVE